MSTSNIVSLENAGVQIGNAFDALEAGNFGEAVGAATGAGIIVTFKTHRGGEVRYLYTDPEAVLAIQMGEDPAGYSGTRLEE